MADTGTAGNLVTAHQAAQSGAYTLVDRAVYLTARPSLTAVSENDPRLLSVFSVIPVNPRRAADVNEGGAEAFVDWLLAEEAQGIVGAFRRAEHRVPLFLRPDQLPLIEPG